MSSYYDPWAHMFWTTVNRVVLFIVVSLALSGALWCWLLLRFFNVATWSTVGFSNHAVRERVKTLRQTLSNYTLQILSPPHAKQTWIFTPQEKALYRLRWQIEEVFRQLKDPLGAFRLTMANVRRRRIRLARLAMAVLHWNMTKIKEGQ